VTTIARPLRRGFDNRASVSDRWTAQDAFETLGGQVLGYLRAAGAIDPEDLLGEVFVGVTTGIGRFRGDEAALRAWVFTIARRRLSDQRRRERRRVTAGDTMSSSNATTAADAEPFDTALLAALNELTADQREVVVLRFVADLPLKAVASITHRRVGAVKALQERALRNLAARLDTSPR
jgi:RNA polymerase sigma-70 factor (ECF subfamily)